ncbi:hypothetical protein BDV28DRAFT_136039 [Aspergillus coremiiformis]|uniref:Secreted protein n=1 Tax=Aspergillus coremiiformis TaxID=138285 RepID=A0A5N6Z2T5_9EURO|nr:hypothetical protein BDV28DRAFT_136039 [Aspergillus coremiiformis]
MDQFVNILLVWAITRVSQSITGCSVSNQVPCLLSHMLHAMQDATDSLEKVPLTIKMSVNDEGPHLSSQLIPPI